MKKFKFKIRGNEYGVHIKSLEDNKLTLDVNGSIYDVEIEMEKKPVKTPKLVRKVVPAEAKEIEKKEASKLNQIKAPLPGKVLELNVKEGDAVKKGDVLMVMEAMKMENNIMAEKEGVVRSIKAIVGENVLEGDVLIETE